MKFIYIKIFFCVTAFFSALELETMLSELNLPFKISIIETTKPHALGYFNVFAYDFIQLKSSAKNIKNVFIVPELVDKDGSYSGGKTSAIGGTIAVVYSILGYDERNRAVTKHEIGHELGAKHNTDPCNVMNSQPCGLLFNSRSKKEIYRKQFHDKTLNKINFRKLMNEA